ncbi:hypothetical protein WR25_26496 [Diploscapter pachys]|uniref:Uncharacterized protein n=1 Tax=Diploscapter pachys TaxID=2018661 RepID=A0A2A2KPT5_9BILA|nr:hypothetical protein WR25_26496 [Diploscapter pachys]
MTQPTRLLATVAVCLLAATPWITVNAAPSCPSTLPSSCLCESTTSGRLAVSCDGAPLNTIFKELGSAPIERLYVGNCSQPVLDRLPQGPVRSLQITNCSIKEVKSEVSSATW